MKEQALARLAALENEAKELRKIIEMPDVPKKPTPEERFWQLCHGLELKIDPIEYPNKILLFKRGYRWFEYDSKTKTLWCSDGLVWSVFENEYSMENNRIRELIKDLVEKHFKCTGVTPKEISSPPF